MLAPTRRHARAAARIRARSWPCRSCSASRSSAVVTRHERGRDEGAGARTSPHIRTSTYPNLDASLDRVRDPGARSPVLGIRARPRWSPIRRPRIPTHFPAILALLPSPKRAGNDPCCAFDPCYSRCHTVTSRARIRTPGNRFRACSRQARGAGDSDTDTGTSQLSVPSLIGTSDSTRNDP